MSSCRTSPTPQTTHRRLEGSKGRPVVRGITNRLIGEDRKSPFIGTTPFVQLCVCLTLFVLIGWSKVTSVVFSVTQDSGCIFVSSIQTIRSEVGLLLTPVSTLFLILLNHSRILIGEGRRCLRKNPVPYTSMQLHVP